MSDRIFDNNYQYPEYTAQGKLERHGRVIATVNLEQLKTDWILHWNERYEDSFKSHEQLVNLMGRLSYKAHFTYYDAQMESWLIEYQRGISWEMFDPNDYFIFVE